MAGGNIFGLFDSELDADRALSALYAEGWKENQVEVLRREGRPVDLNAVLEPPTQGVGDAAAVADAPLTFEGEARIDLLRSHGLPEAELPFFSRAFERGATILVIRAPGEAKSQSVRGILSEANARVV